jgi:tetratricopeptide (TPR) repeat protein
VGLLLAASVVAVVVFRNSRRADVPQLLATLDTRTVSGWPSALGASAYRPYATSRGVASAGSEELARAELRLEHSGDWRSLGTLALMRHDLTRADAYLQHLADRPDALSDRGLVRLEQSNCDEALEFFDRALRLDPTFLPARFNRAVCLRTLGLSNAAEQAFRAVTQAQAGGWSAEAAQAQADARGKIDREAKERETVRGAARALISEQTVPPDELLRRYPTWMRSAFYHALAGARTTEQIRRLESAAAKLDHASGGEVLQRLTRQAVTEASRGRAALADRYERFRLAAEQGHAPTAAELEALFADARRLRQNILLLQAYENFRQLDVGPERERLVAQGRDPWSEAKLAYARAHRQTGLGQLNEAERILRTARASCQNDAMVIPCYWLSQELFDVYDQQGRISEAMRVAEESARDVRRQGLTDHERKALTQAAEVQTGSGRIAAARATFEELKARQPGRCAALVWMQESLAEGYLDRRDVVGTREALAAAPPCDFPNEPWRLAIRLRLGLLAGDQQLVQHAREAAASLASAPDGRERERVEAQLLEGMAEVELNAPDARAALERTLGESAALVADRDVRDRRAEARVTLAFAELRRADPRLALVQLAQLLETTAPARCSFGLLRDIARDGWVAVDAQGVSRGGWELRGTQPGLPSLHPEARAALGSCESVAVLATGSLQGLQGVLPDELAWSYRVGNDLGSSPLPPLVRRLVVRGALPPPELQLPPLGASAARGADWTIVEGSDATPHRVLSEMKTANLVDLEVHGRIDSQVPDGAVLALSEDRDRSYALSAAMFGPGMLTGRPVVMLGACHAAEGSALRKEPWSLPRSLVKAGARAVLASQSELPDPEIEQFFDRIRKRVEDGVPVERALRDERILAVRDNRPWARSVVAFQ